MWQVIRKQTRPNTNVEAELLSVKRIFMDQRGIEEVLVSNTEV